MRREYIPYWIWAIGTVLIALSWFGLVSSDVGWGGFAAALIGSIMSFAGVFTKDSKASSERLAQLARQRSEIDASLERSAETARQRAELLEKSRQRQEIASQLQDKMRQNQERHAKILDKWEEQARRMDETSTSASSYWGSRTSGRLLPIHSVMRVC